MFEKHEYNWVNFYTYILHVDITLFLTSRMYSKCCPSANIRLPNIQQNGVDNVERLCNFARNTGNTPWRKENFELFQEFLHLRRQDLCVFYFLFSTLVLHVGPFDSVEMEHNSRNFQPIIKACRVNRICSLIPVTGRGHLGGFWGDSKALHRRWTYEKIFIRKLVSLAGKYEINLLKNNIYIYMR